MANSVYLPKLIKSQLMNNTDITSAVGGRIKNLVADLGTQSPYITFSVVNIIPHYSKDGCAYDSANIEIVVAASDYDTAMEISGYVRTCFENRVIRDTAYSYLGAGGIECTGISEFYSDDYQLFVKRLSFDFGKIINIE